MTRCALIGFCCQGDCSNCRCTVRVLRCPPIDITGHHFIAEQIKTNIRELEGALIRVVAYSLLEEKMISLEMAKVILKDMVKETVKIISVEMIQKEVADYYNISVTELKAKKRNKNILFPRQVAMYLSRQLTKLSLPEIGQAFGVYLLQY